MGKILNRKSATKWNQNSESALVEVWNEKMEDLRSCRKNRHILSEMVAELKDQGYKYTLIELKTKMHNMTTRYRRERQKIENGGSASQWELYELVENLFGQFNKTNIENPTIDSINNYVLDPLSPQPSLSPLPSSSVSVHSSPSLLLAGNSPQSPLAENSPQSPLAENSPQSPLAGNSPPSAESSTAGRRRRRKTDLKQFFKSVLKSMEQIHNDINKTSKIMVAIEKEKVEILKSYVDKEAEVQNALVEFLNNN